MVTTVPRIGVGQISDAVKENAGAQPNPYPIAKKQIATIATQAAAEGLLEPDRSATPR